MPNLGSDYGAGRRTKLARMRTTRPGTQIGAKVELRRQEDDSEQQSAKTYLSGMQEHLYTKTELSPQRLLGQATPRGVKVSFPQPVPGLVRLRCYANMGFVQPGRTIFGRGMARQALAVLACAMLLYFAAGGSLLHQHTNGPENACHICQSLHVPVLAASILDLLTVPELIARYSSFPQQAAPSNCFSPHRALRAPPFA
jgi:hypothetical protein